MRLPSGEKAGERSARGVEVRRVCPEPSRAIEGLVRAWFDAAPHARASIWVSHDAAQAARMSERHLTMKAGVLDEPAVASTHEEPSR